jgi:hypothetical protein
VVGGWQLGGEARAGVFRLRWLRLARTTPLGELVLPPFSLPGATTIDEALDPLIQAGGDAPFLVLGPGASPSGVLRLANLRGCPRAEWFRRPIADVATPLATVPRLDAGRSARDALVLLDDLERGRTDLPGGPLVVVARDGVPVAALDRRRILVRLLTQERREEPAAPAEPPPQP